LVTGGEVILLYLKRSDAGYVFRAWGGRENSIYGQFPTVYRSVGVWCGSHHIFGLGGVHGGIENIRPARIGEFGF